MDKLFLPSNIEAPLRILVVDDHPSTAAFLARVISHLGSRIQVSSATSGREALEHVKHEAVHILLTDLIMPEMTGLELIETMWQHPMGRPNLSFLMTAYDAPGLKESAERLHVNEVIEKPVHPERILEIITQAMNKIHPAKSSTNVPPNSSANFMDLWTKHSLATDDHLAPIFDSRELLATMPSTEMEQHGGILPSRSQRLQLLHEVSTDLIASRDLDVLVATLLRHLSEALGTSGGVVLLNRNGVPFQRYYRSSGTTKLNEVQPPDDWFRLVNNSREGFILDNVFMDSFWSSLPFEQIGSAMVAPFWGSHGLLGFLILTHEQESYFTMENLLVLQIVCSQAIIAIEMLDVFNNVSEERNRLSNALYSTSEAILMFDEHERLVLMNRAGEQLFTDPQARLGTALPFGLGYEPLIMLLRQTSPAFGSSQLINWPDFRTFLASITPAKNGGQIITLHNVTYFREWEKIRNESLAGVSRELKEPVAMISSFGNLIKQAGTLNEQQTLFVQRVQSAAWKISDLMGNLLQSAQTDMASLIQSRYEMLDIKELTAHVVRGFETRVAGNGQHLFLENSSDNIEVHGDRLKIMHALQILIGNAIQATPKGGRIYIGWDVFTQNVKIKVKDTGAGIPTKDLPLLFHRFDHGRRKSVFKDEKRSELTLVKAIAEEHGGSISIESELGKGSCFCFNLPLITDDPMIDCTGLIMADHTLQGRLT